MKTVTKGNAGRTREEPERPITWSLRGRTYVPVTPAAPEGPGARDEDGADAKTDDGGTGG